MTPVAADPVKNRKERACKHCGCTYFTPCDMGGEGCAWVSKDECSGCVDPFTKKPYKKKKAKA